MGYKPLLGQDKHVHPGFFLFCNAASVSLVGVSAYTCFNMLRTLLYHSEAAQPNFLKVRPLKELPPGRRAKTSIFGEPG